MGPNSGGEGEAVILRWVINEETKKEGKTITSAHKGFLIFRKNKRMQSRRLRRK